MTRPAAPDSSARLATLVLFVGISGQAFRNLVGWWGYGAVVLVLAIACAVALVRTAPRLHASRWPRSLVLFLAFATISIAWSAYPGASAIGVTAQLVTSLAGVFLALCTSRRQLLHSLGRALRLTAGLSLAFELVVAVVVRAPVLPLWIDLPDGRIPQAFYWTRGLLLEGGPIQGIVGNRNLLGFAALLGLVVVVLELAARLVTRRRGVIWIAVFVLLLVLTRSATVGLALAGVAVVAAFALWARRRGPSRRRPVYLAAGAVVVAAPLAILALREPLLALAGRSADLTGRFDIWASVTALAEQRPVFGWGWVSYWVPWVAPFDDLAERNGVLYLQAHDAWLDVWFQLGVVGLAIFVALVASTLWRSWFLAVDRPRVDVRTTLPFDAVSLLPLLIVVALLGQSLAESRMLTEIGWMLLVAFAITTRLRTDVTSEEAVSAAAAAADAAAISAGDARADDVADAPIDAVRGDVTTPDRG